MEEAESFPRNSNDLTEMTKFCRHNRARTSSFSFKHVSDTPETNRLLSSKNSSPGLDNVPVKLVQLWNPFISKYMLILSSLQMKKLEDVFKNDNAKKQLPDS